MLDEEGYKIHGRDGFTDKGVILMAVIVEGDGTAIIGINAFKGDGRAGRGNVSAE